ncbi:hypothetical protein KHP62_22390, partial [Rhodobacteraceae bacterium NNCM2]|nr:hypothetical protein [Coraliihabitans acroporae]
LLDPNPPHDLLVRSPVHHGYHLSILDVICNHLFIILLSIITNNVEESQFVNALGGGDNTEPISQLVLLEELLGQVLEVVTRVNRGLDLDALSILNDGDLVTQVALQSIDLKVVLEELLESSGIEDLVVGGLLAVDNKLALDDWSLLVSGFGRHFD